jgi:activator of HSP90 ATPase
MKNIHQKHHITAPVEDVYLALTNPLTLELWTGYPAKMSTEPGSEFSLFEDEIVGKNLEFKINCMIKQQWYFEGEPNDSIVTISLKPEKDNTVVELVHENVPEDVYDEMEEGWKKIYFASLKRFYK